MLSSGTGCMSSYVRIDHYTLMNVKTTFAVTNFLIKFIKANRISAWLLGRPIVVLPFPSVTITHKSHRQMSKHSCFSIKWLQN